MCTFKFFLGLNLTEIFLNHVFLGRYTYLPDYAKKTMVQKNCAALKVMTTMLAILILLKLV